MNESTGAVRFFYTNPIGRFLLFLVMKLHLDRIAVAFLKSPLSRPYYRRFIKNHGLDMTQWEGVEFKSYRDFFCRSKKAYTFDEEKNHLISPADSLLLAYPIDGNSVFSIKGSHYAVSDLVGNAEDGKRFVGGTALIFRLCPTDYHHYLYIDDAYQRENRFIPGLLHSVQPVVLENVPVFTQNRRSCAMMDTEHFGTVAQIEVGALIVGGIVNPRENCHVKKGEEKGYFDLCGSTVVLLFEKDRMELLPEIAKDAFKENEVRVTIGQRIGTALQ